MGLYDLFYGEYDIFYGECPFCGAAYIGQSKLFDCAMNHFEVGKPLSAFNYGDMRLEMKDQCIDCEKHPIAVIKDSIFAGFEKDKPTKREGSWGAVLPLAQV